MTPKTTKTTPAIHTQSAHQVAAEAMLRDIAWVLQLAKTTADAIRAEHAAPAPVNRIAKLTRTRHQDLVLAQA
ncbi:MAG: hypothetical protein ACRCZF_18405 [Gemmataceae bacterium]